MASQIVTKETLKRIISDITEIIKNPLHDNGIYYEHDQCNVLKGYVLIIPQCDSPYQYGNYFFSIEFPTNYPYSPPKMKYLTNNGFTRFHPNLYRNGKVCLSLLNTWKGDKWTSCNTLSSLLLQVTTLFTDKPFLHEPGINENHPEFDLYTKAIEFQNYETSIFAIISKCLRPHGEFPDEIQESFDETIKSNYIKNKDNIDSKVQVKLESADSLCKLHIPFYKMNEYIDYSLIYSKLKEYNTTL